MTANQLISVGDAAISSQIARSPRYDRSRLDCGIAHIGVGNFHRAHQALYLNEYLHDHHQDWTVHGVGLLDADADLIQAMNSQDNLYVLAERAIAQDRFQIVGSIKHFTHAPSDPQPVSALLASAEIKIISLTITEKGYHYTPAGDLDVEHPQVRADLIDGATPRTALGNLFAAARMRMMNHGAPVTIMSCDNVPGNGDMVRRLLLQFAELREPRVAAWIRSNTSSPNCVVDRITPPVTGETRAFIQGAIGVDDRCPVVSESYLQWIVEDRFIKGRPELESVGVRYTDDVTPYEQMKVRLLNGSHSALAYVSYLMGYRRVDLAMRDPLVRGFVRRYMDEDATPAVPAVAGIDLDTYKSTLIERFSNPAIADQVQRLAEDGSTKILNFMVPALEHQLASGGSVKWFAFALAAWYRYLRGIDEAGSAIEISDPMRDRLTARAKNEPHDPLQLLSVTEIFGNTVSSNRLMYRCVRESLDAIDGLGTRRALVRLLDVEPPSPARGGRARAGPGPADLSGR